MTLNAVLNTHKVHKGKARSWEHLSYRQSDCNDAIAKEMKKRQKTHLKVTKLCEQLTKLIIDCEAEDTVLLKGLVFRDFPEDSDTDIHEMEEIIKEMKKIISPS